MRGRALDLVSAAMCVVAGWSRSAEAPPPASVEQEVTVPEAPAPAEVDAALTPNQEAARAVAAETEIGRWDRDAIARIRTLLQDKSLPEAREIMRLVGFDASSARVLGRLFSLPATIYDTRLGERTLLTASFVHVGASDWELTSESAENFKLPFHPKLVTPLAPPVGALPAKGQYERCDGVGRFHFASGVFSEALRCTLGFRGHRFLITTSTDLMRDDWSFADRIDRALSNVPVEHLKLVREIVIDPGDHPSGTVSANTSWDGTRVNLFLAGAGRQVAQAQLDRTTAHELGHVVSLQQADQFWRRWDAAIAADKIGVSTYGLTNHFEDAAECYELYLGGGRTNDATRARYRHRFDVMDTLFAASR